MRMIDTRCRVCDARAEALQKDGGSIAPCVCGGERERVFTASLPHAAHGDDIPGGVWMKHGICNEDGTPKQYFTRHEIRDAARKAGVVSMEESGRQLKPLDDETARNLTRKGYENPNVVCMPGSLTPEDEKARIAHWWAQEQLLKKLEDK